MNLLSILKLKLFALLVAILCSGCSSMPEKKPLSYSKVYKAKFEEVWRACQQALIKYPMRINNMDTGILQTEFIKGNRAFKPPTMKEDYSSGYRYRLKLRLVKGNLSKSREAVKVTVAKDTEIKTDFFSDPKRLESDGLEEKVILYRIEKEISVERALQRAQKKANN